MAGVYILSGPGEGSGDDLPTVYVGQGDEIRTRMESHIVNKDFWDWGYAFVSKGTALNRAHTTWLEHALIDRAHEAGQCHLDNGTRPQGAATIGVGAADTQGFLREILRVLPLLGVRVFENPLSIAVSGNQAVEISAPGNPIDTRDTVVVPAQEDGFQETFLGEKCWYAIRISGGMLSRIKYIAAYRTAPVSAITHYAPVDRIESYGDGGKYRLYFSERAKEITPIPFGDATSGSMQGPLDLAEMVAQWVSERGGEHRDPVPLPSRTTTSPRENSRSFTRRLRHSQRRSPEPQRRETISHLSPVRWWRTWRCKNRSADSAWFCVEALSLSATARCVRKALISGSPISVGRRSLWK